jgi:hypothetical protein
MLHPYLAELNAQSYRQRLLQEVEAARLVQAARLGKLGLQDRLLLHLGEWLVVWGLWLKHQAARQAGVKYYHP